MKQSSGGVLAALRACDAPNYVRLGCSLAAALPGCLFERPDRVDGERQCNRALMQRGLFLVVVLAVGAQSEEVGADMKRRQQGILTGMPFMTHVSSRSFVDDTGRKISLAKTPVRIVSLAPSITEILFAIGAGGQVAGVTQFCDFPPEVSTKPKVGYANPNLESLVALQPDLVLAPKEFLKPELLAPLDHLHIPLFVVSGQTVDDIFSQIEIIGRMTDHQAEAAALTMEVRRQLVAIKARMAGVPPVRVLYVLNSQPLITVGPGSYIDQLIGLAGGLNVAAKSTTPYP
ncbi:MAG: ABC transporter substrate-binding protein, partial [Nitrospira sp.]|nr:ABC transporter substrate-binding protein [Nitrospira sp.]